MLGKKYYYVIVNKMSGKMLLSDGKLPFYWNKKVAKDMCAGFNGFKVCKVGSKVIDNMVLYSLNA